MTVGQRGRDARLGDGCFVGYYAFHKPGWAVGELRQSGWGEQQGPGLCRMPGVVILGVSGRGYAGFWI